MIYYPAKLVAKHYIPSSLEKGMLFLSVLYPNSDKQRIEIWELEAVNTTLENFVQIHGYPVKLYIVDEDGLMEIAAPHEIGLLDKEEEETFVEFTIKDANIVLNQEGDINILIDETYDNIVPYLENEKVVLHIPEYIEEEGEE